MQAVYGGAEGDLWELVMGEQIHIGGLPVVDGPGRTAPASPPACTGIDLCCCTGAGMRFLVTFCGVARMPGVDATSKRGRARPPALPGAGLDGQISFTLADVCASGLPLGQRRFRLGRGRLVLRGGQAEADRRGGPPGEAGRPIAFTDWVEGPAELTDAEAERFLTLHEVPERPEHWRLPGCLSRQRLPRCAGRGHRAVCPYVDLYLEHARPSSSPTMP